MGKRSKDSKPHAQSKSTMECATCVELRSEFQGPIKTITREQSVQRKLEQLVNSKRLTLAARKGLTNTYICSTCSSKWQWSGLDNCVAGWLSQ
ncbi:MAG: hypothetical protein HWE13_15785 [Gammaproteobacteria bacterium]|nr:hypothetical protein [Gammaproteobacteria bacterium]NVK89599.1 hypothetical protein [Gammaproteobacteria bacterium]